MIDNLLAKADPLLVGGGMGFTFLAAQGHGVGASLLEDDQIDTLPRAARAPRTAASRSCCPPTSWSPTSSPPTPTPKVVAADAIPAGRIGLDIGPDSAAPFAAALADARHRLLERPDGRLRVRRRSPRAPARSPRRSPRSTGSPWSAAATPRPPYASSASTRTAFGHISTGGGASLEYLEGKDLPGIAVLERRERAASMTAATQPLMAGNWKMNLNHQEAVVLVQKLACTPRPTSDYGKVEVAVLPPFTDLRSVQTLVDGDRLQIRYGAQDVSAHDDGAYTGEISGRDAGQAGLHATSWSGTPSAGSTTREDDALVNAKAKAASRPG